MRIPIVLSVILLVAALGTGWRDYRRLVTLRATHEQLVALASARGIFLNSADPGASARTFKRPREDRRAEAEDAAASFIAYAKEKQALGDKLGRPLDHATGKRMMDQMERMMALDGNQLKIVIAELGAATDIDESTRTSLIAFSIKRLAKDYPQQALTILTDPSAPFDLIYQTNIGFAESLIPNRLKDWATSDPSAAIDWFQKSGDKIPDHLSKSVAWGLISGSASSDPKLAFQLVRNLGMDAKDMIPFIARNTPINPEQRTATLVALREWRAEVPADETRQQASREALQLLTFGESYQPENFDRTTRWIEGADFSSEELAAISQEIWRNVKPEEAGKWVEWLGNNLPTNIAAVRVSKLFKEWSNQDYVAAENWLKNAPDSPTKNAAIRSYAEATCPNDPATAIQWALTLPGGEARDQTLKTIYQNWPTGDAKGAAAFAKENGIQ